MIEEHMNMMVEKHMYTKGAWLGGEQSGQMPRGGETMGVFLERLRGGRIFGSSRGFFQGGD